MNRVSYLYGYVSFTAFMVYIGIYRYTINGDRLFLIYF